MITPIVLFTTKYESNWMCALYSSRFACIYYQVCLYVCPDIYMCIAFPTTSTLGVGDIKVVPNLTRHLGLLVILGFTI